MAQEKALSTVQDVLRLIEESVAQGEHEVNLEGLTFENFELLNIEIPVSLKLKGSIFNGPINLCRSTFLGAYIDLDGAQIHKGLFFNGLKSEQGYSVYLKGAKVWGKMELRETTLDWLVTEGMEWYPDEDGVLGNIGKIFLNDTVFTKGIAIKE